MAVVLPPTWAVEMAQELDQFARRTLEQAISDSHSVSAVLGPTVEELAIEITESFRAHAFTHDEARARRWASDGASQTLVARLRFRSTVGDDYETGSMHVVSVGYERGALSVLTNAFLCAVATNRVAKARREYEARA